MAPLQVKQSEINNGLNVLEHMYISNMMLILFVSVVNFQCIGLTIF